MSRQTPIAAIAALTAVFMLTGCSYYPEKVDTDPVLDDVLLSADRLSYVGKYIPIEKKDGAHTGVVFVRNIYHKGPDVCAEYHAFTSAHNVGSNLEGMESARRDRCITLKALPDLQPKQP